MLRVVTLNIHKGLSHFNRRVVIHDLREGLRALQPDLVFLQEVAGLNQRHALRYAAWPVEGQHEFLAGSELEHAYGRNRVHQHGHYGNALLSRFPIVSHENEDVSDHRYERRGLLHTVVSVPGWKRNLHCLCVHLSLHERGRRRQLDAIAARLEALADKRLPIIVAADDLDVDMLVEILWKPKNALAKQYERLFEMEGVKLRFSEDALQGVAEEASRRKSGARGLRAILEEVMLDVMYEIPSLSGVSECVVTRDVVVSRSRPQLVREKKAS